jgi:hypothetical protein
MVRCSCDAQCQELELQDVLRLSKNSTSTATTNSLQDDAAAASSSRMGLELPGRCRLSWSVWPLWLPERRCPSSIERAPACADKIPPATTPQGDVDMLPQSETCNMFKAGISIVTSLALEIMPARSRSGPQSFPVPGWPVQI